MTKQQYFASSLFVQRYPSSIFCFFFTRKPPDWPAGVESATMSNRQVARLASSTLNFGSARVIRSQEGTPPLIHHRPSGKRRKGESIEESLSLGPRDPCRNQLLDHINLHSLLVFYFQEKQMERRVDYWNNDEERQTGERRR